MQNLGYLDDGQSSDPVLYASEANAISADGSTVVGRSQFWQNGLGGAFVHTQDQGMQALPILNLDGNDQSNAYGVSDMHTGVWEWVSDFNSLLVSDDSRATSGRDHPLFCAAGVIGATDPNNFPAFLRYGFRSALEGRTTSGGLGFRCAQDI